VDEIYCPLCGKPNPVENTFCEYCLGYLDTDSDARDAEKPADAKQSPEGMDKISFEGEPGSWLDGSRDDSSTQGEEPTEDRGLGLELPAADTSGWLPGSGGDAKPAQDEVVPIAPFLAGEERDDSGEIPSWLDEALKEESSEETYENTDQDDVSPPSFLQPEEAGELTDTPGSQEDAGPLAGLSGLLSAEPGVARIRKAGGYSTRVIVSEKQQEHVQLLTSLIENEDEPKSLPGKSPISQQHIMRWVIAIVLLAAILWSILLGEGQFPLPVYDEGSAEAYRLIDQLPENARVLVGFDFAPAMSDEIDTAAAPLFNHLMDQGALLTMISTSPDGPLLAERFIQSGKLENAYINGLEYTNLGYIPGGAAGLYSFIQNPQGTTPFSIDGFSPWGTDSDEPLPPTVGINQISDYDMIILLADDPDIARMWIEQFTPIIVDPYSLTSLSLITSAQLEPIVRPYFESIPQNVNGLVVGLRGGAAYSRLIGGEQLPDQFWDAFGMGTFIAALLILLGSLAYYVMPELTRSFRGKENAS